MKGQEIHYCRQAGQPRYRDARLRQPWASSMMNGRARDKESQTRRLIDVVARATKSNPMVPRQFISKEG